MLAGCKTSDTQNIFLTIELSVDEGLNNH